MKFSNWPPFKGAKKEDEIVSVEEKFVPAERPQAISLEVVGSQPKEAAELVSSYINGLSEYATQNNIYTSEEKRALFSAGAEVEALARQAITATNPYEKEKFEGRLKALVEKINGPLTENLVDVISKNDERLKEIKNVTPKETEKELLSAVTGVEDWKVAQREAKADNFAEKFGLQTERQALLDAELEYAKAIKTHQAKGIKITRESSATKEQQEKLDQAIYTWSNALAKVGSSAEATPQDKIMAKFISIRDTDLRIGRVREEAALAGLNEKGKTVFGKVQKWIGEDLKRSARDLREMAQGYSNITGKVGEVIVKDVLKDVKIWNKDFDEEKHAALITKANKVVGSAALMTLVAAPAGAASAAGAIGAGLTSFLWRVTRGSLSSLASSAAFLRVNDFADTRKEKILKENEENQATLMSRLRNKNEIGSSSIEEMREKRELHQQASTKGQQTRLQKNENLRSILSVAAVGVQGVATFEAAHSTEALVHSHAVQHALEVLRTNDGFASNMSAQQFDEYMKPHVYAPQPEAPLTEVHELPSHAPGSIEKPSVHALSTHNEVHQPNVHAEKTEVKTHQPEAAPKAPAPAHPEKPEVKVPQAEHSPEIATHHLSTPGTAVERPAPSTDSIVKQFNQDRPLGAEEAGLTDQEFNATPSVPSPIEHAEAPSVQSQPFEQPSTPDAHATQTVETTPQTGTVSADSVTTAKPTVEAPSQSVEGAPVHTEAPPAPEVHETVQTDNPSVQEVAPQGTVANIEPEASVTAEPVHTDSVISHGVSTESPTQTHVPESSPVDHPQISSTAVEQPVTSPAPTLESTHMTEPVSDAPSPQETPTSTSSSEGFLNSNGFDLSKPSVGLFDGNRFSHIIKTGNLKIDSDLSFSTAREYAMKFPDKPVYWIQQFRDEYGNITSKVYGVEMVPDGMSSVPHTFLPTEAVEIPKDSDYKPL
ncbi:hypothetical protein BH11PAT2_BH11PAT2_05110 [soil metagenome]